MGEQEKANVSRQKTRDRISSPDQLTDYLRVTNPGIWVLLASIVLFLAGVFVWFTIGTLESTAAVKVSVAGQQATVIPREAAVLTEGMPLRVETQLEPKALILTFLDQGAPFDPLAEERPDTTSLPTRERPMGGLGLYLVRSLVDEITYARRDGRNVLTVRKKIEQGGTKPWQSP